MAPYIVRYVESESHRIFVYSSYVDDDHHQYDPVDSDYGSDDLIRCCCFGGDVVAGMVANLSARPLIVVKYQGWSVR